MDRARSRTLKVCALLAAAGGCASGPGSVVLDRFERGEGPAGLPPSWGLAVEGAAARPSGWGLVRGGEGHALVLLSNPNFGAAASLCLREGPELAYPEVSCRIRVVEGRGAQGGGPFWRYRGPLRYRTVEWDPLRGVVRLLEGDGRTLRERARAAVDADPEAWHALRVAQTPARVEVFFDGRFVLGIEEEDRDESPPRLRGGYGLRVPGDARSAFDDFRVRAPEEREAGRIP